MNIVYELNFFAIRFGSKIVNTAHQNVVREIGKLHLHNSHIHNIVAQYN